MVKAKSICAKSASFVTEIKAFARETKVQDLRDVLGTAAKVYLLSSSPSLSSLLATPLLSFIHLFLFSTSPLFFPSSSFLILSLKILNDRGIRIKIISIVKLAAGHGDDEVGMAVAGLAQEIK